MSLRARIAVTAAVAVAAAVLLVSIAVYGATSRRLTSEVDAELADAARTILSLTPQGDGGVRDRVELFEALRERVQRGREPGPRPSNDDRFLGPFGTGVVQAIGPDGTTRTYGPVALPIDDATRALAAAGDGGRIRRTADVDGTPVRLLVVPAGDVGAIQLGVPVTAQERALAALRRQLTLMGLLGVGLAAVLGAAVANRAVRPVRRLTEAAEDVGRTQDLTTRIEVEAQDELGRLAGAFNGMLASLEQARAAQRELVADASHELRTPLTSLRTNIEVLATGGDGLTEVDRRALLGDLTVQLDEFGRLVDGLVELARGDRPAVDPTPVPLAAVVEEVVERVAVFTDVAIEVVADESVVVAERDRLERAVANLVDNAVKHGGGPVEVTVADGVVTVRDHGHGFGDADPARAFDRFYRGPSARSRPGSGLGLSIVAQVAEAHGGAVRAGNHAGGGAEVALELPTA